MLRLRDIMTTNVVTIDAGTTVREAMEFLVRHRVSGAPVVSGSILVGVVSATDLMAFAAALTGVPTQRDVYDWDARSDSSADEDTEHDGDPGSAFFSEMWDDAGAEVTERLANPATPEWNALEEHDVTEAMTRVPLVTLGPDASAEWAALLMGKNGIHRVLVTEAGKLIGLVSALDIVKAAAERRFTVRTFVFNKPGAASATNTRAQ